jgi:riboflavin synthase
MFTGLIEEVGNVSEIRTNNKGLQLVISCNNVLNGTKIGDSVAVNGICLTVTKMGQSYFTADVMSETIRKTNINGIKKGESVNLEKSLTLNSYLGGHLVTGDVDCRGTIKSIRPEGISKIYEIEVTIRIMKYIVEKGRIAVDGISLTVAELRDNKFKISLIPHTLRNTTLNNKQIGSIVNIETDIIAKHIEKLLKINKLPKITSKFLFENGFY